MAASTVTPDAAPAGTSPPEKDNAAGTSAPAEEAPLSLAERAKKLMNSFKGTDATKIEVAEEDQAPPSVRACKQASDRSTPVLEALCQLHTNTSLSA